ncbi:MAG: UvrD-helicase domain-containing protein [Candidatus Obscuribacterales bacterium]|nr:UvrD-helicase domain-containing protein [Candidatus Obscuribacterales bacterium]
MPKFSNVYIGQRVRAALHKIVQAAQHKKFWSLISKLKDGRFDIPGLNVEKLYSKSGKIFSARLNKEMRLIFSMRKEDSTNSLIIHDLNHHDKAYERLERSNTIPGTLFVAEDSDEKRKFSSAESLEQILEDEMEERSNTFQGQFFKVPQFLLVDPESYIQFEKNLDRYLLLSAEQEEILSIRDRAFLVQGAAGTGKTTLALFKALNLYEENMEDAIYLFTYHEELACVCRAYKVNLLAQNSSQVDSDAGVKVFSYLDFCRRFLRQSLNKKDKARQWLNKKQSIAILHQIIQEKSRWQRQFKAEEIYALIYSILKGRFMPGSDALPGSKEDYERIFRDYGRAPEALAESLEIFAIYQSRLESSGCLDEADIIRLSYESLKEKALLAEKDKKLWIVIDEIQDFTELEWKSILLFWENHCRQNELSLSFPFFSGDTNQNISRSGFRWQELESYLQSRLRALHRPNSLKEIVVHQNYRNTLQIHILAAFLRKLGSDAGDLGLAPEFEGRKAELIIASDQEFLSLLKREESASQSNPLVVLVENEESLSYLRKELSSNESIFLLSLASSKGMEFEDVIIHRAFSSAEGKRSKAETSRAFDLWYMGITRARKNLLLVQTENDQSAFAELLAEKHEEFNKLVEISENEIGFSRFMQNREEHTPNYNVIFLERKLAEDLFELFRKEQESLSDNQELSDYARQCKDRALRLWRRCLDYSALGRALMYLNIYEEAAAFLKRAGLLQEAANCLEAAGQYTQAAHEYESIALLSDAARSYEYAGDFLNAGRIHEELEDWSRAAENYQSAGDLSRAASSLEKSGMLRSAADIYQKLGSSKKAAKLYSLAQDHQSAAEIFLQINDKLDAAESFQKAGIFKKSMELFEELGLFSQAAELAAKASIYDRSAKLYLKAGMLNEAAEAFEIAEMPEKSAELYEEIKNFQAAAALYEQAGKSEKAACNFEQAGLWQKALELALKSGNKQLTARCREKLGDYQNAAEIYESLQAFSKAAYCLEKANEYERAADLHLKADNNAQAAACLAKLDRRFEAAKLYVVSGQIKQAYELAISKQSKDSRKKDESNFKLLLNWCIDTKRTAAAAELLECRKDYAAAALKYKESLMLSKAAECLEKSGKAREAARLYQESSEFLRAAECYKEAKLWTDAALCFEKIQNWSEARKMYEKSADKDGIARCDNALNWF